MTKKLLALLIANLFAAAPAFAQSDDFRMSGSVSVGGINVDDDDAADASKLNEYRDLSSGGLLGFDFLGRSRSYWLNGYGENLGRDDMYINFRGGMYDGFKYRLYYDALKHNFLFGGRTPYNDPNSTRQTTTFPRADTSTWNDLEIGYKRRDAGGYFEFQRLSPWYFRAEANQVTNTGSKIGASSQGTSPGNGNVDLAFPTEYETKNATLEAGYNTKTIHAAISWMTSKFDNDFEKVDWTNGYFSNGIDSSYLPPDNKYQRIAGNATFRGLPVNSTLALRFTMDELESDATIATQALTTGGAMGTTGPSVPTFNGKVENDTFSATLHSTPMRGLDTRIYYNYYKRDDTSTHVTFNGTIATGYENELFSYKKNNYGIDGYWRFDRANRLGAGFDFLKTERTRFDFDESEDKRFFVEYKNSMLDNVVARLKYTMLERDSSFLLANDGTGPNDVAYWNRFLKAYDVTDLDRDEWKLTVDWTVADGLDLSFEGITKKNKYRDQVLGRLDDDRQEIYASASYVTTNGMRFTVFGDVERVEYNSRHRVVGNSSTPGAYDPATPATADNYNWEGKNKDKNWAAGIAFEAAVMPKLALKASAIYYKTDGSVDFAAQRDVTSPSYPQPIGQYDDSKRTSLNVKGVYTVDKNWTVTLGYAYEKYEYSDAQFDGYRLVIPNSNAAQNSYFNGYYANPDYKANIFYGWVTYRF